MQTILTIKLKPVIYVYIYKRYIFIRRLCLESLELTKETISMLLLIIVGLTHYLYVYLYYTHIRYFTSYNFFFGNVTVSFFFFENKLYFFFQIYV